MNSSRSNHIKTIKEFIYSRILKKQFFIVVMVLTTCTIRTVVYGQEQAPQHIKNAIQSVEKMLDSKGDEALVEFIEQSMVKNGNRNKTKLVDSLKTIRTEMKGLRNSKSIEAEPEGLRLIMSDGKKEKHLMIVVDDKVKAISHLYLVSPPEYLKITLENISEIFNQLENDGAAGLIYVKINDELIIKRAFGYANKELGILNDINTVFGTGSRPIDYTVAAIYLLDQKGFLDTRDNISKYIKEVPKDKAKMTIQHLFSGQSGLPDFFDNEEDWDPDLG